MEISILSEASEQQIVDKVESVIKGYIDALTKVDITRSEFMTRKDLIEDFQISLGTLKKWERNGLTKYEPQFDDSRTIFYKRADVAKFLIAQE